MSNSQIVKRYTTNKICCLATNNLKTDRKIKYGNEDALCCVAKDFRAQTFLKMMQCSSEVSGATWYHAQLKLVYSDKDPAQYDYVSDLIITSNSAVVESYDGTQSTTPLSLNGDYGVLNNLDLVTEAFAEKMNTWGTSQPNNTFFAFASYVTGDPGYILFDIYHDSSWGNNDDKIPSLTSLTGGSTLPFDNDTTVLSYEKDGTITSSGCFTEAQLCAMKRVVDDYCKSCN
jgi:hypothetical protein